MSGYDLPGDSGAPIFEEEDLYVEQVADHLQDRRVTVCVTSGIAAMVVPRVIRQLRRYGADVQVIMSWTAAELFGTTAFEWASARPVIKQLTGLAEHIRVKDDVALVLPATLHTVAQMAHGIANGPVTTYLSSALGLGFPVVLVPAMHRSMYRNPFFQENLERLLALPQVSLVPPRVHEGKAKLADRDEIAARVCRAVARDPLRDVGILMTAGPTRGYLDPVRFITNISSGELGVRLATDLYHRGARVHLVYGPGQVEPPPFLEVTRVETPQQMLVATQDKVKSGQYQVGIFAAAVGDYVPGQAAPGKIGSGQDPLLIELVPTAKIIRAVDEVAPDGFFKVGFKLESGRAPNELLARAEAALRKNRCRLLVANDTAGMEGGRHEAMVLAAEGGQVRTRSKAELVGTLARMIGVRLRATYYTTVLDAQPPPQEPALLELAAGLARMVPEPLAGSVSCRRKSGCVISARGVDLRQLAQDQLVELVEVKHEAREKHCRGQYKGAMDLLTHDLIYQEMPSVGAVLHVHDDAVLEVAGELGLPLVEVADPPPSVEHAFKVMRALPRTGDQALAVRGHGLYVLGSDPAEALARFERVHRESTALLQAEEQLIPGPVGVQGAS